MLSIFFDEIVYDVFIWKYSQWIPTYILLLYWYIVYGVNPYAAGGLYDNNSIFLPVLTQAPKLSKATPYEFMQAWNSLKATDDEKLYADLLEQIEPEQLPKCKLISFIYSLIHLFIHMFIHSFIYSFIHTF